MLEDTFQSGMAAKYRRLYRNPLFLRDQEIISGHHKIGVTVRAFLSMESPIKSSEINKIPLNKSSE